MRPSERTAIAVLVLVASILVVGTPAYAQSSDSWSFILTPQFFISHIPKNGFAAPPKDFALSGGFNPTLPDNNTFATDFLQSTSSPQNTFNPQYGIQLAAQKGRLTLSGAFQYVDFKTINDITFVNPQNPAPFCLTPDPATCTNSGDRWAKEVVATTRIDVELSASYFFPAVVPDWLDFSAGAGFKFIYASSSREPFDLNGATNLIQNQLNPPGLYTICPDSPCVDVNFKQRVHEDSYLYGVTFPMSAFVHLTNDARWLMRFGASPLLGAEVRNDRNVAYSVSIPPTFDQFVACGGPPCINVNRQDGTKFAYGVTADATVNWQMTDWMSAYGGVRVQYIHAHDTFLAYGPLVGMSFRFGGK
jgi:hypothetical protein